MYSYIVRRLAFGLVTIVAVSILVFVILRVLPGDPLVAIFGMEGFTKLTAAERASYMAQLGLSDPLVVQYLHWVRDIVSGNFGHSFFRAESVGDMIAAARAADRGDRDPSVVLSWIVGIPVAIVSALQAQQHRRQYLPVSQHPVPGGAGVLAGDADRARAAVRVRLPRAAGRRVAVCRSRSPICRSSSARRSCWASARPPISRAWRDRACSR